MDADGAVRDLVSGRPSRGPDDRHALFGMSLLLPLTIAVDPFANAGLAGATTGLVIGGITSFLGVVLVDQLNLSVSRTRTWTDEALVEAACGITIWAAVLLLPFLSLATVLTLSRTFALGYGLGVASVVASVAVFRGTQQRRTLVAEEAPAALPTTPDELPHRQRKHTVHVVVVDRLSEGTIEEPVQISRSRAGGQPRETTVDDGSVSLSLTEGDWTFEATYRGVSVRRSVAIRDTRTIVLSLPPRKLTVSATDAITDTAITGPLTVTFENGGNTVTVDFEDGAPFTARLPVTATAPRLTIEHESYHTRAVTIAIPGQRKETQLTLDPLTGTVTLDLTLDGHPVADAPVEVVATGGPDSAQTRQTDAAGRVSISNLPYDTYRLRVQIPGDATAFENTTCTARVDGPATHCELDVTFTYDLSRAQARRVDRLRDRQRDLVAVGAPDASLPAYYARVIDASLTTVDELPTRGECFFASSVAPSAVAIGLLDAIAELTTILRTVLAGACQNDGLDCDPQHWDGQIRLERLLMLTDRDVRAQREHARARIKATWDYLSSLSGDDPELTTARALVLRLLDLLTTRTDPDPVGYAALICVTEGLIDAVEQRFDRERRRGQHSI
jgi:hypothetical protein